jgi:GTPase Era involved in 16S rRNA processing
MKRPRRKYSRTPGLFMPRRWTENIAMKLTKARLSKIDGLLLEVAALWGEEDEGICQEVDDLRRQLEEVAKRIVEGHAELAEQRRLDRLAAA